MERRRTPTRPPGREDAHRAGSRTLGRTSYESPVRTPRTGNTYCWPRESGDLQGRAAGCSTWKGTGQHLLGTGKTVSVQSHRCGRAWNSWSSTLKANALYCMYVVSSHEERGKTRRTSAWASQGGGSCVLEPPGEELGRRQWPQPLPVRPSGCRGSRQWGRGPGADGRKGSPGH